MPLTKGDAEQTAKSIIDKAKELFYDGGTPTVFGMNLVPSIKVVAGQTPNGNLAPAGSGGMGMEVSQGLLNIPDTVAIKFAIGHELGHGFSETILTKIGLKGVSGSATEVIADLAAAFILTKIGHTWPAVLASVQNWQTAGIFDANRSGDHPPGAERVTYINSLFSLMSAQAFSRSFEAAAKLVCNNLRG